MERATGFEPAALEPEEPVTWLVDGLLPSGGLSLLAAKPKVGKSTLARCLAVAVARGEPFLGRRTAQGPVLYLAMEEKESEVARHFRVLGAGERDPIYVHVGIAPEKAVEDLVQAVWAHRPVLVIIDPLLRLVRVQDANSYAEVTAALEPLLGLARQAGAHTLLVHHLGKGERQGGDAILGSTALFGVVDTAIMLRRTPEGSRIIESIQRYGPDLPPSVIALDPTGRVTLAGSVEEHRLGEAEAAILEALAGAPLTEPEIRVATGLQSTLVGKALRSLLARGALIRSGSGVRGDPYRYSKPLTPNGPVEGIADSLPALPALPTDTAGRENRKNGAPLGELLDLLVAEGLLEPAQPRYPRPAPCWACGGTDFWETSSGSLTCRTCHPPASPRLVARWWRWSGDRWCPANPPSGRSVRVLDAAAYARGLAVAMATAL